MIKDEDSRYYANLPVSQTKDIEYKFVVDGRWCFADDLPHRADWSKFKLFFFIYFFFTRKSNVSLLDGNINNVLYKEEASH
jgi:hypothetical protein